MTIATGTVVTSQLILFEHFRAKKFDQMDCDPEKRTPEFSAAVDWFCQRFSSSQVRRFLKYPPFQLLPPCCVRYRLISHSKRSLMHDEAFSLQDEKKWRAFVISAVKFDSNYSRIRLSSSGQINARYFRGFPPRKRAWDHTQVQTTTKSSKIKSWFNEEVCSLMYVSNALFFKEIFLLRITVMTLLMLRSSGGSRSL